MPNSCEWPDYREGMGPMDRFYDWIEDRDPSDNKRDWIVIVVIALLLKYAWGFGEVGEFFYRLEGGYFLKYWFCLLAALVIFFCVRSRLNFYVEAIALVFIGLAPAILAWILLPLPDEQFILLYGLTIILYTLVQCVLYGTVLVIVLATMGGPWQ